jgi:flagellar biosynthesis/type III secretory pathway protein FliH
MSVPLFGIARIARFSRPLVGVSLVAALTAPVSLSAQGINRGPIWAAQSGTRAAYDRGFQEGQRDGERDARGRQTFDVRRHDAYRDGDRGYSRQDGDRNRYREEYRRGFEEGYRYSYERVRGLNANRQRQSRDVYRRGGVNEPAYARGYADGFDKGRDDFKDRHRYDPLRHGDYRDGDNGYDRDYGSKDAYKQYYREGFRSGYEDGFRGGDRRVGRGWQL